MKGHYTVNNLVHRYKFWLTFDPPLKVIHWILTHPQLGNSSYLPHNMRQRMADLLQLELVIQKLL